MIVGVAFVLWVLSTALLTSMIWRITLRVRDLEVRDDKHRAQPAKIEAELAALEEAVQSCAETHRRFAGKVWQRLGPESPTLKPAPRTGTIGLPIHK